MSGYISAILLIYEIDPLKESIPRISRQSHNTLDTWIRVYRCDPLYLKDGRNEDRIMDL